MLTLCSLACVKDTFSLHTSILCMEQGASSKARKTLIIHAMTSSLGLDGKLHTPNLFPHKYFLLGMSIFRPGLMFLEV